MAKNKPGPESEPGNPDGCVIGKKEAKTLTASVQVLSDAFLSGAQTIRASLTLLSDTISEMALKIRKVSEGFNRTRKTTNAKKEKGETVQESGVKTSIANKANANQAKEKPGFVIRTFRSLFGFSQKGQHPGSIYTHDIHSEKILAQIASTILSTESKQKEKKVKSKPKAKKEKTDLDLQIDELRSKFPILTKLFIDGPAQLKEEFKYWSGVMAAGWGLASSATKSGAKLLNKGWNIASESIKYGASATKKAFEFIMPGEDFEDIASLIEDAVSEEPTKTQKTPQEFKGETNKFEKIDLTQIEQTFKKLDKLKFTSDSFNEVADYVAAKFLKISDSLDSEELDIRNKKEKSLNKQMNMFISSLNEDDEIRKKQEEDAKNREERARIRQKRSNLYLSSGGPATPSKDDAKGTDTAPAMLTPGEFVVNKDATKKNRGMLEQINNGGKTQKKSSGGPISYLAPGGGVGSGGSGGGGSGGSGGSGGGSAPAAAVSPFIAGLTLAGKSLGVLSTVGNLAVGAITGTVGAFSKIISFASPFVEAFNPALIEQMNLVFKDLTAVIGMALEPVIGAVIPIVRAFADRLVPVVQALIPTVQLFADAMMELAGPIIEILIEAFAALEPIIVLVVGIVKMWADILVQSLPLISAVIKEVVWWFTKIISTMQWAIGRLISMIPGTGNIGENMIKSAEKASKATDDYYKGTSNVQKAVRDPAKKGASVGAAAGKASFSGISDLGRNLMQSAMSSSTQASAIRTAENTEKMDKTLTSIDQKMGRFPLPNPAAPARGGRN